MVATSEVFSTNSNFHRRIFYKNRSLRLTLEIHYRHTANENEIPRAYFWCMWCVMMNKHKPQTCVELNCEGIPSTLGLCKKAQGQLCETGALAILRVHIACVLLPIVSIPPLSTRKYAFSKKYQEFIKQSACVSSQNLSTKLINYVFMETCTFLFEPILFKNAVDCVSMFVGTCLLEIVTQSKPWPDVAHPKLLRRKLKEGVSSIKISSNCRKAFLFFKKLHALRWKQELWRVQPAALVRKRLC